MKPITLSAFTVALLACASVANAGSINVLLDEEHQVKGNKGAEFRPVDLMGDLAGFLMTARSSIDENSPFDPNASGLVGTVYIDKDGAGTQTAGPGGSKGISGGGGHKDEELVFTFDVLALTSSIKLGLIMFKPGHGLGDKDDPVLFLNFSGVDETVTLDETEFLSAYMSTGRDTGIIDFGQLGFGSDSLIESFAVRETGSHIEVNSMAYSLVPLPAPLMLGLAGLAGLGLVRRRALA